MTQHEHVYVIFCWSEVAGDVIFCEHVKVVEYYAVLNFEFASFSSFRYIQKNHFLTAEAAAKTEADIDDSIKRKHIRVSLKKAHYHVSKFVDAHFETSRVGIVLLYLLHVV